MRFLDTQVQFFFFNPSLPWSCDEKWEGRSFLGLWHWPTTLGPWPFRSLLSKAGTWHDNSGPPTVRRDGGPFIPVGSVWRIPGRRADQLLLRWDGHRCNTLDREAKIFSFPIKRTKRLLGEMVDSRAGAGEILRWTWNVLPQKVGKRSEADRARSRTQEGLPWGPVVTILLLPLLQGERVRSLIKGPRGHMLCGQKKIKNFSKKKKRHKSQCEGVLAG